MRTKYIQNRITGEIVEVPPDYSGTPRGGDSRIMPDLPDFVSPIDGKLYRGRAGLREHCKKYDVVPTADLKGLPVKTKATEYKPDRKEIRETIVRVMYQKGYLR